jgi:hypothetical protein
MLQPAWPSFTVVLVPAQAIIARWLESFEKFPPRAKPASFHGERRDGDDHEYAVRLVPPSQRPATFTIDPAMEKPKQQIGD